MLTLFFVLIILLAILAMEESAWHRKLLSPFLHRKFGHILLGLFVAIWPWLISWLTIEILGILAIAFTLVNFYANIFHYLGINKSGGYGDMFFALAISLVPLLTHNKIFFLIAILQLALADASAAIFGKLVGQRLNYRVLGQQKTIIGSMAFWLTSFLIIGIAGLFSHGAINYSSYVVLLLVLPPVLALVENFSLWGIDNLLVPLGAVLLLRLIA